jgi:hypothetical protein
MGYYPERECPADLERIAERCGLLKERRIKQGVVNNWVIFKNGTVIAVPSNESDPEQVAKGVLNECLSQHPDFRLISQISDATGEVCHVLLMNEMGSNIVSTYLFGDEWDKAKEIDLTDALCQSEELIGSGASSYTEEEATRIGLYARLRVFADGKKPEVDRII